MKPRTLVVLAVLVLGLGAFIWFVERDLPSSEERAEQAKRIFGGIETSEVEAVEIAWDGQRVRLERRAEEPAAGADDVDGEDEVEQDGSETTIRLWWIAEPLEARADATRISSLLQDLLAVEKRRTLTGDELDRQAVGLTTPRATVTLVTGEEERTLEVGAEVPGSSTVLVALAGGDEAYVVDGGFYDDLTRAPGDWRSNDLFFAGRSEIERLTLGREGQEVALARREGDVFWLEEPVADRADRELVDQLLTELTTLRAQRFVDDTEPAELGLEPPVAWIEARVTGRAEPFRIELGDEVPDIERRYGRAAGQVFATANGPALAEAARREAAAWRSPAWTGFRPFGIDALTIEGEGEPMSLERAGPDWLRGGENITFTPVSNLLHALVDAEAERILTPEEAAAEGFTLTEPLLTLTVQAKDVPDEILTLYPEQDGVFPARAGNREVVLLIPAERIAQLREKIEEVRATEVVAEEEAEEVEPEE